MGHIENNMATFTARKKILKDKGVSPDSFEESVAQALFDLEATSAELKGDLRDLYIMSAKEVDTSGGRKAVVIHVPFRLRKGFQKIQDRLVRELEKKFSGKHVVIVAHRKIMKPPKSGYSLARSRSRSLTAVHEAMLNDVCYPTEIVGKRTRLAPTAPRSSRPSWTPRRRTPPRASSRPSAPSTRPSLGRTSSSSTQSRRTR